MYRRMYRMWVLLFPRPIRGEDAVRGSTGKGGFVIGGGDCVKGCGWDRDGFVSR